MESAHKSQNCDLGVFFSRFVSCFANCPEKTTHMFRFKIQNIPTPFEFWISGKKKVGWPSSSLFQRKKNHVLTLSAQGTFFCPSAREKFRAKSRPPVCQGFFCSIGIVRNAFRDGGQRPFLGKLKLWDPSYFCQNLVMFAFKKGSTSGTCGFCTPNQLPKIKAKIVIFLQKSIEFMQKRYVTVNGHLFSYKMYKKTLPKIWIVNTTKV